MSHQPFENWILDVENLSAEERRELQAHVSDCHQCERLQRKWQLVYREMRAQPVIAPAAGFAQRWQSGLAERRIREQRRQSWRAFVTFLGGALVFLMVLVVFILSTSSPSDWLAVVIRYGTQSLDLFDTLRDLALAWLANTPLALNIALWIYASITLCLLSLGWVFALWRTSNLGVFHK